MKIVNRFKVNIYYKEHLDSPLITEYFDNRERALEFIRYYTDISIVSKVELIDRLVNKHD